MIGLSMQIKQLPNFCPDTGYPLSGLGIACQSQSQSLCQCRTTPDKFFLLMNVFRHHHHPPNPPQKRLLLRLLPTAPLDRKTTRSPRPPSTKVFPPPARSS